MGFVVGLFVLIGSVVAGAIVALKLKKKESAAPAPVAQPPSQIPPFPAHPDRPEVDPGMYTFGHLWHWNGREWLHESPIDIEPVTALWGTGAEIYAVGWGEIWHRAEGAWEKQPFQGPRLFDLHGIGSCVYAVGPQGLFRLHEGAWHPEAPPADGLWSVWVKDKEAFAVGNEGVIVRCEEGIWHSEMSPTNETLRSVRGDGDLIFAVGDKGTILRRTSAGWAEEEVEREGFESVWVGKKGVWAITREGSIFHRDANGAWERELEIQCQLTAIRNIGDTLYVLGLQGTIYRSSGNGAWQNISGGAYLTVNDIYGSAEDLWIGGDQFYELT